MAMANESSANRLNGIPFRLAWQAYGLGHLAKSIHGYYLAYRNFDNEMKTNRWFAKYETGSDRFGEQVGRIEFQGFNRLEVGTLLAETTLKISPTFARRRGRRK
jgi:hypothetical protein